MITDPKTIGDMAFNTATTCSFAIPGYGPVIAAGLSLGQMAFDLFFPAAADKWDDMMPTNKNLQTALDKLLARVGDDAFNRDKKNKIAQAAAENDLLARRWQKLSNPPKHTDFNYQNWVSDITQYFKGNTDQNLDSIRIWLELYPSAAPNTFQVYALVGSTGVGYHKLRLVWQYRQALIDFQRKLDDFPNSAEYLTYQAKYKAWKSTDRSQPAPPEPDQPAFDAKAFIGDNPAAEDLVAWVNDLVGKDDASPGFAVAAFNKLDTDWKNLDAKIVQRISQVSPVSRGAGYYTYVDTSSYPPQYGPFCSDKTEAAKQMAVYLDGLKSNLQAADHLEGVTRAQIDQFGSTIEAWKKARQMVVDGTVDMSPSSSGA